MLTPSSPTDAPWSLLNTGISGLDDILGGGLESRRRPKRIDAGGPLTHLRGILAGEPVFTGSPATGNQR